MRRITPDLVPLALSLVEVTRIKDVLDRALESLETAFPRALVAIVHRERLQRFAATASPRLGTEELRALLDRACGPTAVLSADDRPGTARKLDGPVFSVGPRHAGARRRIPDLVLAVWVPAGSPLPPQQALDRATRLVGGSVKSAKLLEGLLERNTRDSLTGLLNRRGILDVLRRERALAQRYGRSLSILFFDLNRFKEINDQHGHLVGDETLSGVAAALARGLRTSDAVGRVGGDEFLAVLPDTDLGAARRTARRLAEAVAAVPIETAAGALAVTLSVGASCLDEDASGKGLLERADFRMLSRKRKRALAEAAMGG
jgi:diguanylate cyclase (GGDEF)-like protein